MFISRDPIELEGGLNIFQYAPNPIEWVDPFGLKPKNKNQNGCEKGYKAINSQSPLVFKKSKPKNSNHPKGVYLSIYSPERLLHKKGGFKSYLGITSDKSEYYFQFKVNKCELLTRPIRPAVRYTKDNIIVPRLAILDHGKHQNK